MQTIKKIYIKKGFFFAAALILGGWMASSCSNDSKSDNNSMEATENTDLSTSTNAASSDGAVQHFVCPNKCEGSGGPINGTCPVCGTAYTHNQAFHNTPEYQQKTTPDLVPVNAPGGDVVNQPPASTLPAQNADGEYHYFCSFGCGTGAGDKGVCPKCGNEYAHNAKYHQSSGGNQPPPQAAPLGATQSTTLNTSPAAQAKNAAGVYHYICGAGHKGGSGSQGNCAECGQPLVHNSLYHQ